MRKIALALIVGLGLMFSAFAPARAAYPDRPIKVIIPYKAGGQSDLSARKIADIIQKKKLLSQPMVIVNMPGANTRTGLRHVQESAADGYTLLLHHSSFLSMHTLGQIPMSFRDYDMLGQVISVSVALTARPNLPWKNAKEMVADLKKNPDKIVSAGVPGLGTSTHVILAYYFIKTDILKNIRMVYLGGGTECKTALMGDKIAMYAAPPLGSVSLVQANEAKFLLFSDDQKWPDYPDADNFTDFGLQPLVMRNGFFGPKGMPQDVRNKLEDAIKTATETDEFKQFASEQGAKAEFMSGADWFKQYDDEEKIYLDLAEIIKKEMAAQGSK